MLLGFFCCSWYNFLLPNDQKAVNAETNRQPRRPEYHGVFDRKFTINQMPINTQEFIPKEMKNLPSLFC
jgi:hypothetical protein